MVVICYLLNKLAPIINPLGVLGLFGGIFICDNCWRITGDNTVSYICTCSDSGIAMRMYVITIVLAVVGLIFGIFAHKNDISSDEAQIMTGGYSLSLRCWDMR